MSLLRSGDDFVAQPTGRMPFLAWHFGSGSRAGNDMGRLRKTIANDPGHAASVEPFARALAEHDRIRGMLEEWRPVLALLPVDEAGAARCARRAHANGTRFIHELLSCGLVEEEPLFEAIAAVLGLMFIRTITPDRLLLRHRDCLAALSRRGGLPVARLEQPDGAPFYILASPDISLSALQSRLAQQPRLARRLLIAAPGALRRAVLARARERLLFTAQYGFHLARPEFSARRVATAWQGVWVGVLIMILLVGLLSWPIVTMLMLQVVGTIAFFFCVAMRILALGVARPLLAREPPQTDAADLPLYSVLVALRHEREVIPQLLVALGKIQWPHSKLEIKLVCEEDDAETLATLRTYKLRSFIEIVEVPVGEPRTKPKALAYALPLCSGEFITLFDAEDIPHPAQLLEAWHRFRSEDETLACLQAPLVTTNLRAGPLSRMFAFEYAGLFRGMLPWLARKGLVLPLGGTSNHFRRAALLQVGGWDPYNVTEDADLGLRLKRFGYRIGVINLPTFEEAPEDLTTWLPQRVRWFKGWIQTWLVHMREPFRLWRELGPASFLAVQILFLAMLVSVFIHPLAVVTILWLIVKLCVSDVVYIPEVVLAGTGLVSVLAGYAAFLALGKATLSGKEKQQFWKIVLLTPVHWLLLSLAAWMALGELYRQPHRWNKTPHRKALLATPPCAAATVKAPRLRPLG